MRDFLLRMLTLCGMVTGLMTELLSEFHLLRRVPLAITWALAALAAMSLLYAHRPKFPRLVVKPLEAAAAAAIMAIVALVGLTAWLSPPNTFDALSYHMPRVIYWAQSGSIDFFPTPYLNQISFPPLAEYFMLHTYLLSGGDHFVNMVGFAAFAGSIAAASAVAAELGLTSRGQAFAALFCATLPSAILQASGPKNDTMVALWLLCAAYFAARGNAPFLGLSLGLALAAKGTAYVFAPPLIAGILLWGAIEGRRPKWLSLAAWLIGGILLMNGPQYARNLGLSGSPLGYDSPFGNESFRFRNERPGWKPMVSNALRDLSEQLGTRRAGWNQSVFDTTLRVHRLLHIDPQDPDTTWQWGRFEPPADTRHEANANNRWHLLLLAAAAALAAFRAARRSDSRWLVYGASVFFGFLLFCFWLRWQPYGARLELPLFVLAAPLAGFLMEEIRPPIITVLICLFLVDNARLPALENWIRPLRGPHNLWITARQDNYFSDILGMNNRESYLRSVDLTARSGCARVGLDISENQLEYPFQALLRERNPAVRFEHTGVENASARYEMKDDSRPCAVLCLDCAGIPRKVAMYGSVGPPVEIGRFLLFLGPGGGLGHADHR